VIPVCTEIARMPLASAAITSDVASPISEIGASRAIELLAARLADGQLRQAGASLGHLAECAEAEIIAQAGAFQFAPADARQIAGHQRQQDIAPRQPFEQRLHAGTMLIAQFRADPQVVALAARITAGMASRTSAARPRRAASWSPE
jgi:hypothetical protein